MTAQSSKRKSAGNARKAAMERAMKARQNRGVVAEEKKKEDDKTEEEETEFDFTSENLDPLMEAMRKNSEEYHSDEKQDKVNQSVKGKPVSERQVSSIASNADVAVKPVSYKTIEPDNNAPSSNLKETKVDEDHYSNNTTAYTQPEKSTTDYVDNPSAKGSTIERFEAAEKARKEEEKRKAALEAQMKDNERPVYQRSEVEVVDNRHDNGSRAASTQNTHRIQTDQVQNGGQEEPLSLAETTRLESQRRAIDQEEKRKAALERERLAKAEQAEKERLAKAEQARKEAAEKKRLAELEQRRKAEIAAAERKQREEAERLAAERKRQQEETRRIAAEKERRLAEERKIKEQEETARLMRLAEQQRAQEELRRQQQERERKERELEMEKARLAAAKKAREEEEQKRLELERKQRELKMQQTLAEEEARLQKELEEKRRIAEEELMELEQKTALEELRQAALIAEHKQAAELDKRRREAEERLAEVERQRVAAEIRHADLEREKEIMEELERKRKLEEERIAALEDANASEEARQIEVEAKLLRLAELEEKRLEEEARLDELQKMGEIKETQHLKDLEEQIKTAEIENKRKLEEAYLKAIEEAQLKEEERQAEMIAEQKKLAELERQRIEEEAALLALQAQGVEEKQRLEKEALVQADQTTKSLKEKEVMDKREAQKKLRAEEAAAEKARMEEIKRQMKAEKERMAELKKMEKEEKSRKKALEKEEAKLKKVQEARKKEERKLEKSEKERLKKMNEIQRRKEGKNQGNTAVPNLDLNPQKNLKDYLEERKEKTAQEADYSGTTGGTSNYRAATSNPTLVEPTKELTPSSDLEPVQSEVEEVEVDKPTEFVQQAPVIDSYDNNTLTDSEEETFEAVYEDNSAVEEVEVFDTENDFETSEITTQEESIEEVQVPTEYQVQSTNPKKEETEIFKEIENAELTDSQEPKATTEAGDVDHTLATLNKVLNLESYAIGKTTEFEFWAHNWNLEDPFDGKIGIISYEIDHATNTLKYNIGNYTDEYLSSLTEESTSLLKREAVDRYANATMETNSAHSTSMLFESGNVTKVCTLVFKNGILMSRNFN